jgi:hypothetical protein
MLGRNRAPWFVPSLLMEAGDESETAKVCIASPPHGKQQSHLHKPRQGSTTMELCSAVYDNSKRLLSVAETAQFLNVSESWVRRHITELPSIRVGRLLKFDPQLLRWEIRHALSSCCGLWPAMQ